MGTDIDDILGSKPARKKRNTYYRRKDHGDLHRLIGKALPYICGPDGVANLHELAKELELTYAACHKWMRPGQAHKIPPKRADRIVELSQAYADSGHAPPKFKPATKAEFLPFLF